MKKKWACIIALLALTPMIGIWIYSSRKEYKEIIGVLESMNPQQVTKFEIYPRVGRPFGTSVTFNAQDQIVSDFIRAIKDRQAYPISRDRATEEHQWFLEVATEYVTIQIEFCIPYQKGDIVVGRFGKFPKNGANYYYNEFQSQQLYDWYQKYSHRWLTPEDDRVSE